MFDPVLTRYSDGRAHDHGPVSKRILRETVDVTLCLKIGDTITNCRNILFETPPIRVVKGSDISDYNYA